MNILDENIIASQRQLLRSWRIKVRQIGFDMSAKGIKDQDIITLLIRHSNSTFFTRDVDFYNQALCHNRYCLVCLNVGLNDVATFVRRILRHVDFNTIRKRLGKVMLVSSSKIQFYQLKFEKMQSVLWINN